MQSRNTRWVNCWLTNDSRVVQNLIDVNNLQIWFGDTLMVFLSAIVSKAIRMILVHYYWYILGNFDGIVTTCYLWLLIGDNIWFVC